MKFSTLLALASPALVAAAAVDTGSSATIEKRSCYGSGESWGNERDKAVEFVKTACNGALGQVTYGPNENKARCYNLSGNKKVNFNIKRIQGLDRFLGAAECEDGLSKEVKSCGQGGMSAYSNWQYT